MPQWVHIQMNLGDVRIKKGGSHNGHNGLKSIDQFIGKNYNRVRIGVSRPSKLYEKNINENVSNWVLSDFTLEDKTIWLNSLIDNSLTDNDLNILLKYLSVHSDSTTKLLEEASTKDTLTHASIMGKF